MPRFVDIERVEAPSRDVFVRRHLRAGRPAIFTGLTRDWRPRRDWAPREVARRWGDTEVVSARLRAGKLLDDGGADGLFERIRICDFIDELQRPDPASHYVMAPTWNFPPSFQDEYRVPTYCEGAAHLRAKFWIGKAGTTTPYHRDVPHNLNVHLDGRKEWLLVSPRQSAAMYPCGVFSGMPNFSRVDPDRPDDARQPRYRDAEVLRATVGPGETLFIPHGWWHHARSLDDAVAMNFWWGGLAIQLVSLASTTFKRLTGIRKGEWS